MDKKMKQYMGLIAFGVVLYVALMNLPAVFASLKKIADLITPLLMGGVMAFILSVPMNGFENMIRRFCSKRKKQPRERAVSGISLLLTILSLILVLFLVFYIVVPELVVSVKGIVDMVQEKWPEWAAWLNEYNINTDMLADWIETQDVQGIVLKLLNRSEGVLGTIAGTAASTISGIVTAALSLVVMFYVLLSKKELAGQCKKLLYANVKEEIADRVIRVAKLVKDTYSKFLSGQCIEAIILGVLMFLAFSLFRLPYAGLVAILTTVCAFVPYIGAFVSCGVGVFLTLLTNPIQAIICLVVYQVVQFVENQFIYPRVVGNSVGLSPLWTFVAVLLGGKLFGVMGILFFIPLTSVLYTLLRDDTNQKLARKKQQNRPAKKEKA